MLNENLFLVILGLVWIVGAVVQDLRRREVDNIWNFSLIAFALGYRFAFSVFSDNYWFVINGLIGFGIFLILGNLFYYAKVFAGGDAKLLIALGAVLPFSYEWMINFKIFGLFILLFLIGGSIYALIYSFVLVFVYWNNFIKEYLKQFKRYRILFWIGLGFFILWLIVGLIFSEVRLFLVGVVIFLFPILFIFAKAIEESCMVRLVKANKVTEGDWLYNDVKIKGKIIKANWQGVSKRELELIKKNGKKVLVKYGIPFTPSFLIAFIVLIYFMFRFGWF